MRFSARCPQCKREIVAHSVAALEIKAPEHYERCRARAIAEHTKALARAAQPSLPFGGDS